MTAQHERETVWPVNERYEAFRRPRPMVVRRARKVNWQVIRMAVGLAAMWTAWALLCIYIR